MDWVPKLLIVLHLFCCFRVSVHPMSPVQFLRTWKLLQDLVSFLTSPQSRMFRMQHVGGGSPPWPLLLDNALALIHRCSMVKVLQMKGLVKKDLSLSILAYTEKNFINRFVVKHGQDVNELF